ncbi:MAG: DUF4167 domain-containing protein [Niveispirillum sp.]|nr:DUF4167 domain-containing protein [Niveispirillum sp.]
MRQGPNNQQQRRRGRGGNGGGGNGGGNNGGGGNRRQNMPLRHQNFDSSGPDVRIRGNAFQVYEKYQALARDAHTSGDRVAAENYLQHAEHYYRIICQINEQEGRARQHVPRYDGDEGEGGDDGMGDGDPGESDQPAA